MIRNMLMNEMKKFRRPQFVITAASGRRRRARSSRCLSCCVSTAIEAGGDHEHRAHDDPFHRRVRRQEDVDQRERDHALTEPSRGSCRSREMLRLVV